MVYFAFQIGALNFWRRPCHLSHVIKVLGRAGMFKEAEHFINSVIPSESGASASSLLCAAKQNGNDKTVELTVHIHLEG